MKLLISRAATFLLSTIILIASALLLFAYFFSKKFQIPLEAMTADPLSTFNAHPFTGLISNLGALLWCATATVCLFSGSYIMKNDTSKKRGLFLISNGVITSLLLMDDFFMLHEYIFHQLQLIFYAIYLIGFIWYCYHFISLIFKTEFLILGLAFMFLAASVFTDIVFPNVGFQYFIEDGFKFLGIALWGLYFIRTSYSFLLEEVARGK